MTTPAPAGPDRAISEHIPNINGQTLNVSRNHLPGRGFLQRGARGAADVSIKGDLVPEMNGVVRIVGVEEGRVEFTDTRETVFDNPITPRTAVLAMAGLSPRTPDSVSKHRAKGSGVGRDVGSSTDQVVEVVGGGWG